MNRLVLFLLQLLVVMGTQMTAMQPKTNIFTPYAGALVSYVAGNSAAHMAAHLPYPVSTVMSPLLKYGGYAGAGAFVLNSGPSFCAIKSNALDFYRATKRHGTPFNTENKKLIAALKKDVRPYSFIMPLLLSCHSQSLSNALLSAFSLATSRAPAQSTLVEKTIWWTSMGAAAYLMGTDYFGLATRPYISAKVKKINNSLKNTRKQAHDVASQLDSLSKDFNTRTREAKVIEKQIIAYKKQVEGYIEALQKTLESYREDQQTLNETTSILSHQMPAIHKQLSQAYTAVTELHDTIITFRKSYSSLLTNLQDQIVTNTHDAQALVDSYIKTVNENLETLSQECQSIAIDNKEVRETLTDAINYLSELHKEFAQETQRIDRVTNLARANGNNLKEITELLQEQSSDEESSDEEHVKVDEID